MVLLRYLLDRISFNPRAPCGARPETIVSLQREWQVSIHAPRVGRDMGTQGRGDHCGGVSIHAPRVGRDMPPLSLAQIREVSIHAPRVGRDSGRMIWTPPTSCFNPRAPCGARPLLFALAVADTGFNPRAPCGARLFIFMAIYLDTCFNPRAPCGARRIDERIAKVYRLFQSTRPVWGATLAVGHFVWLIEFQSTRPVWGATRHARRRLSRRRVSIHAPRVGRDSAPTERAADMTRFNPRAPCGARLFNKSFCPVNNGFQSTRPVWGATCSGNIAVYSSGVSIHAPRVGRDSRHRSVYALHRRFNPRAPCGARRFL